jgi:hypothetical protein
VPAGALNARDASKTLLLWLFGAATCTVVNNARTLLVWLENATAFTELQNQTMSGAHTLAQGMAKFSFSAAATASHGQRSSMPVASTFWPC